MPLKRQIDGGEPFDVVVLTPPLVQDLVKGGKVAAGSTSDVAKTGIGVAIRAGAPKPDVSTVDAFKRALLNAKSIIYSKEGQSGTYMASLIDRLGLAEQLKSKIILETRGGQSIHEVAAGNAEIGFSLISEILPVAGAAVAGPLPADIQSYVRAHRTASPPQAKDAGRREELHRSSSSRPPLRRCSRTRAWSRAKTH